MRDYIQELNTAKMSLAHALEKPEVSIMVDLMQSYQRALAQAFQHCPDELSREDRVRGAAANKACQQSRLAAEYLDRIESMRYGCQVESPESLAEEVIHLVSGGHLSEDQANKLLGLVRKAQELLSCKD